MFIKISKNHTLQLALQALFYFLAFFIIATVIWLKKEFGEVTIDQILYHLQYGTEGLLETDQNLIDAFIRKCILKPLVLALITTLIQTDFFKYALAIACNTKTATQTYLSQFKIGKLLVFTPFYILFLVFSVTFALIKFSVFSYTYDTFLPSNTDFYENNYIPPSQVSLNIEKPRNLVLIYVESLETTYENASIFNDNLIHSISSNTLNGLSFSRQRQLPGTGWTMAGIVSTQCAVPLRPSFGGGWERKNTSTEYVTSFLPNIECLGDILKKQGYTNVFMGGASLSFAGKGKFFKTHGYDETYGRDEFNLTPAGKFPQNHWGIFDDVLLSEAKKKMDELENAHQPYNLTLLTLDTHGPIGSFSETCTSRGALSFKDIVRCTSSMLSELVLYMEEKGYLENTTVVIMGDHLVMENTLSKKLQKNKERFIFNTYVARNLDLKKNREEITHFDHLPTILDSLNLTVNGGKMGLGISGFHQRETANTLDRFNLLNENATKTSNKYLSFWNRQNDGKTTK